MWRANFPTSGSRLGRTTRFSGMSAREVARASVGLTSTLSFELSQTHELASRDDRLELLPARVRRLDLLLDGGQPLLRRGDLGGRHSVEVGGAHAGEESVALGLEALDPRGQPGVLPLLAERRFARTVDGDGAPGRRPKTRWRRIPRLRRGRPSVACADPVR